MPAISVANTVLCEAHIECGENQRIVIDKIYGAVQKAGPNCAELTLSAQLEGGDLYIRMPAYENKSQSVNTTGPLYGPTGTNVGVFLGTYTAEADGVPSAEINLYIIYHREEV